MKELRSDLPRGAPLLCHAQPAVAVSCQLPPHQQQQLQPDYYPHGSGLPRGCRVSVLRKDLYDLIGKDPKLPLEVVLRISIQGVVQEGEQRVRWDRGFR